jgi:hypothetical protein
MRLSERERELGLDNSESRITWKLSRILDRHPAWLSYLADFIAGGNRLLLLPGNHDAEMWWPAVHGKLAERLVETYFGGEEVEGLSPSEFAGRIEFAPWLYHLPGVVHVQHGHQFDEYCSLLRPLAPQRPGEEELLELSSTSILIRYGLSKVRGVRTHDKDEMSLLDFLRWMGQLPRGKSWDLIRAYLRTAREQIRYWRALRRADSTQQDEQEAQALLQETRRSGLSRNALRALAELSARPANIGYGSIASSMYLDTFATVVAAPTALVGWTLLSRRLGWRRRIVGAAAIAGSAALLLRLFAARRGTTEVSPKLREGAARVAPVVGTPFVVMGHSHKPELSPLPGGATFVNTGCWLQPDANRSAHGARCDCPLTYVELRTEPSGETIARLMRWCLDQGRANVEAEHTHWAKGQPPSLPRPGS